VYRFVFEQLTCKLVKVLVELVPVPVLGDVAHEEPVVVVRDGHAHLPAFADLTTIELSAPNGRTQHARTHGHTNQIKNRIVGCCFQIIKTSIFKKRPLTSKLTKGAKIK